MGVKRHVLVIGGSGMLAKASLWLAEHSDKVSVIGRNRDKLNRLVEKNPHKNIIPITVNYYDLTTFRHEISQSIDLHGPYDLVVAWVHSQEKEILDIVSDEILKRTDQCWRLYHVLGSSSNLEEILRELDVPENCDYYQVQLGFVIEHDRSRWLTHEEISDGVIHAIRTGVRKHLVGTLTPWHRRP